MAWKTILGQNFLYSFCTDANQPKLIHIKKPVFSHEYKYTRRPIQLFPHFLFIFFFTMLLTCYLNPTPGFAEDIYGFDRSALLRAGLLEEQIEILKSPQNLFSALQSPIKKEPFLVIEIQTTGSRHCFNEKCLTFLIATDYKSELEILSAFLPKSPPKISEDEFPEEIGIEICDFIFYGFCFKQ